MSREHKGRKRKVYPYIPSNLLSAPGSWLHFSVPYPESNGTTR